MRKNTYSAALDAVIGSEDAGEILGVSAERAKQFCREGRLVAKRIGRDWVISRESAIELAKVERSPGDRMPVKKTSKKIRKHGR